MKRREFLLTSAGAGLALVVPDAPAVQPRWITFDPNLPHEGATWEWERMPDWAEPASLTELIDQNPKM